MEELEMGILIKYFIDYRDYKGGVIAENTAVNFPENNFAFAERFVSEHPDFVLVEIRNGEIVIKTDIGFSIYPQIGFDDLQWLPRQKCEFCRSAQEVLDSFKWNFELNLPKGMTAKQVWESFDAETQINYRRMLTELRKRLEYIFSVGNVLIPKDADFYSEISYQRENFWEFFCPVVADESYLNKTLNEPSPMYYFTDNADGSYDAHVVDLRSLDALYYALVEVPNCEDSQFNFSTFPVHCKNATRQHVSGDYYDEKVDDESRRWKIREYIDEIVAVPRSTYDKFLAEQTEN